MTLTTLTTLTTLMTLVTLMTLTSDKSDKSDDSEDTLIFGSSRAWFGWTGQGGQMSIPLLDLLCGSARLKCGERMALMGRLEPDSAPISKNVKTIQIRAELTNLGAKSKSFIFQDG